MAEKHPSLQALEEALAKLNVAKKNQAVIIDLLGWNNRDSSLPITLIGLFSPEKKPKEQIAAAARELLAKCPDNIWANLSTICRALLLRILDQESDNPVLQSAINTIMFSPPEITQPTAVELFSSLVHHAQENISNAKQ